MIHLIRKNYPVFISLMIFWISAGILLIIADKDTIHLFINRYNSYKADLFFKYITYLGDGITPVLLTFALLFVSTRKAIIVGVSNLVGGLLTQFLKRVVFNDMVRPKAYFKDIAELHFVSGVDVHSYYSFPSGHTTTAFILAICLIYFTNNNYLKFLYLFLAFLTGYSRMYLSQHFLIDVYAGSILGTLVATITIYFLHSAQHKKIDKPLIKVLNDK